MGAMDDFWQYAGSYWWLAFPLFGMVAAIGGAWDRRLRQRHKRRLEMMRARAELRAAKAGHPLPPRPTGKKGKGGEGDPATDASTDASSTDASAAHADAAAGPVARAETLTRLIAEHDAVTRRWLDYELDVAKLIAYPAMSDGRQPLTAAFLRAKKVADGLRPASPHEKSTAASVAEYRGAVADYGAAFEVAERDARRIRDAGFTEPERKRLSTAQQLLSVALDEAATPAERQTAYRRVRVELDGLIALSDDAVETLEERVALQLPPSS